MNQSIQNKLAKLRNFCASDKASITYVRVKNGANATSPPFPGAVQYFEFLKETDGARFGIIDLFGSTLLPEKQSERTQFDPQQAYCVGQVLYEPLFVGSHSGAVFLQSDLAEFPNEVYADFDHFLDNCAMGPEYAALCARPDEDRWYRKMIDLGFIVRV